jgi:hypothetical protein
MIRSLCLALALHGVTWAAEDPVFSGPQVGEKLPAFEATYALDEDAGKPFEVVKRDDKHPTLVVFVNEITRPGIGLTRLVLGYAATRKKDKLASTLVFLSDDVSEAEARIKRARHAMPQDVPIGIAIGGKEGPGSYGLNHNVQLTVLVANEGKVTANFALVQPSVAADGPRIGAALADVLGDKKPPTLEEMGLNERGMAMVGRGKAAISDGQFRALLQPLISKNATPEQVTEAAQRIEDAAAKNEALKERLGTVARRIIDAGRLENYGTKPAQEFLTNWAKEFQAAAEKSNTEAESVKAEKKEDEDADSE